VKFVFKRILQIFLNAPGGRPYAVTICMLLASLSEMISMGALVPLVSQLNVSSTPSQSVIGNAVVNGVTALGIAPSTEHLLILVGVTLVLKSAIAFLAMRYVAISVAEVTTRLRSRLLASMMNARWAYFVDHRPGEVAGMISGQSSKAGDAYIFIAQFITTSISGLGLVITAFLISTKLVIFCIIAIAALAIPLSHILKIARRSAEGQWQTSNELSSGVQDVLSNMKPLKSMARQGHFLESFALGIEKLKTAMITQVVSRHGIYYGQDILGAIMIVVGIYVGVVLLRTPLSEFLVIGVIFYQVVDIIKRIQLHLQESTVAAEAYQDLTSGIDRADKQREVDYGKEQPDLDEGIRFEDVSFSYGAKKVLRNINLHCPAREITVLIGSSGSGKTTLIDLIIGFYLPSSGRILVDGVSMADIQLSKWRKKIGYVPQELTLLRGSIADNIKLGDESITTAQVNEALRLAGASGFVEALPRGIDTDIGTMGAKLSGGQRQRISLARALVLSPKLLLLDEVTSALDEASEAEICQNIMELAGKFTVVAITHRPAWKRIAKTVYSIADGQAKRVAKSR
jgi:ATP-binding cassette, subfamily C, bacterial